jgi:hypothetical protein
LLYSISTAASCDRLSPRLLLTIICCRRMKSLPLAQKSRSAPDSWYRKAAGLFLAIRYDLIHWSDKLSVRWLTISIGKIRRSLCSVKRHATNCPTHPSWVVLVLKVPTLSSLAKLEERRLYCTTAFLTSLHKHLYQSRQLNANVHFIRLCLRSPADRSPTLPY